MRCLSWCLPLLVSMPLAAQHEPPREGAPGGLETVSPGQWDRRHVRRVLQAFAFGGKATERQVDAWAGMDPVVAIEQMLTFEPVNTRLSQGSGLTWTDRCRSLHELQQFWGSDRPDNPLRLESRPYLTVLDPERAAVSSLNLYLAWTRAMHTPGCNTFAHKVAFYLTNYHAAIHIRNAGPVMLRSYYDDTLGALAEGADFVDLMTRAASHAALAVAYGHAQSRFTFRGSFQGNDDFAREYFQLLFGIQGTSEDPDYHEQVTIEHNAWLLTGMMPDARIGAGGSRFPLDWLQSPIVFTDHFDAAGRYLRNRSWHYDARAGADSCLEILGQPICGATAQDKLEALGPVAAAHPESMASTPVKLARFFGDDQIDAAEAEALRIAWADAGYDLLAFLRAYAISTQFHAPGTFKLRSAFERNLVLHNSQQLTADESYAEHPFEGPLARMYEQGALVFAPIRDVFGGQTGADAANDRYLFKQAWDATVDDPAFFAKSQDIYQRQPGGKPRLWRKDWGSVIPRDGEGLHRADAVGRWLWERLVGDGGVHYDVLARAQVNALLVTGFDFGAIADPDDPERVYRAVDLAAGEVAELLEELGRQPLELSTLEGNQQVGMAIGFISALPFTFAMEVPHASP